MMKKEDLKYTKEHDWLNILDGICIIGITDYAQNELGDIVFVELPEQDIKVNSGESVATIEAVKTVADVYAPISGKIIDSNRLLLDNPELINSDPFNDGWIIKIKIDELNDTPNFLTYQEYQDFIL